MTREFPGINLVSTEECAGSDPETAQHIAEGLVAKYGAQLAGAFAANESSSVALLGALRAAGLGGKVRFVAFDCNMALKQGLVAGDIQGLVVQNPKKMGDLGVETVIAALNGEAVDAFIPIPVEYVTKANLDLPTIAELINLPPAGDRK